MNDPRRLCRGLHASSHHSMHVYIHFVFSEVTNNMYLCWQETAYIGVWLVRRVFGFDTVLCVVMNW